MDRYTAMELAEKLREHADLAEISDGAASDFSIELNLAADMLEAQDRLLHMLVTPSKES